MVPGDSNSHLVEARLIGARRRRIVLAAMGLVLATAIAVALAWRWEQRRPVRGPAALEMPFVAAEREEWQVRRGVQRIYHRRDCTSAKAISPARLIGWPSAGAAESAGYRRCRRCLGTGTEARRKGAR